MIKYDFGRIPYREWIFYQVAETEKKRFRNAANDWCGRQKVNTTIKCQQLVRKDKDGNQVFLGFEVYKND